MGAAHNLHLSGRSHSLKHLDNAHNPAMPGPTHPRPRNDLMVVAAGVLLRCEQKDSRRWLLLCDTKRGDWGFPKGHAEPGETLSETALRECAEETGIGVLALVDQPLELVYRLPAGRLPTRTKRVVYFPGTTSEETVILSPEHSRFEWATAAEVLQRITHASLRRLFQAHVQALDAGP